MAGAMKFKEATTALMISELINKLVSLGVKVYIGESGDVRIHVPDPVPPESRPLLSELRQRKAEVIKFLRWDEEKINQAYVDMLDRTNKKYAPGALAFAEANRPDLMKQFKECENAYTEAHHRQDTAGCRNAIAGVEAAVRAISETFESETTSGLQAGTADQGDYPKNWVV